MDKIHVLFVGESWFIQTTETKGVDYFTTYRYEECAYIMKDLFEAGGISFTHIPSHRVEFDFPETLEDLQKFDIVMFSDCGANTFLLPTKTFIQGNPSVNKLALVRDYVAEGGSFCMIGGYLTFMGFEGKGRYKRTPIEEIMPVEFYESDDRAEHPEGFSPTIVAPDHPVFEGIDEKIPDMLGYNRTILKSGSCLLAENDGDPIIATAAYGKGKTMAYTCDCAPHWAPLTLCNWKYYGKLWQNIAHWLANK